MHPHFTKSFYVKVLCLDKILTMYLNKMFTDFSNISAQQSLLCKCSIILMYFIVSDC